MMMTKSYCWMKRKSWSLENSMRMNYCWKRIGSLRNWSLKSWREKSWMKKESLTKMSLK
jgi:hypothetical protein